MLGLGVAASKVSGGFSPGGLFTGGSVGAWYDPSDISTLFQDSAGTIPVTADGDPVGKILDKSGNGKHLIQGTSASRPVYKIDGSTGKPYLWTNDSDAWMSVGGFDLSGTENATIFSGLMKDSSAAFAVFCELSANSGANTGAFTLTAPISVATNLGFTSKGTVAQAATRSGVSDNISCNVVCIGNTGFSSPSNAEIRVNNLATVSVVADQGASKYGNHTFYLFRRGGTTAQFAGRMYQLIVIGKAASEAEIAETRAYIQSKVI